MLGVVPDVEEEVKNSLLGSRERVVPAFSGSQC